jgi:hypothetical protein
MSLKRSHTSSKSAFGGGDAGAKVDRQELYDELKRMAASNESFTPVDISLSIGAGEPQVSKALLGLAAEGYLEKVETGKYKAAGMAELGQAEFLKAFARASRVDSTRQRDLAEIARLKQNNDTMRQRLLTAIAERDHYLAALKQRGIDPGPAPVPVAPAGAAPDAPDAPAAASPEPAAPPPVAAAAPPAPAPVPPPPAAAPPAPPRDAGEAAPGPQGLAVPSPASASAPSGPGDTGGHGGSSPPDGSSPQG